MSQDTKEVWKPIPGYSGYEASNRGRVRDLHDKSILKPFTHNSYLKVYVNGKDIAVHRLVCAAFHGKQPKGLVVNHKDLDKLNNTPDNLEYVTIRENLLHAWKNGAFAGVNKRTWGETKPRGSEPVLTIEQARTVLGGPSKAITRQAVYQLCKRKRIESWIDADSGEVVLAVESALEYAKQRFDELTAQTEILRLAPQMAQQIVREGR